MEAETFVPRIAAFGETYIEEIGGIAEGSGFDLADIVALNVRTEIIFRSAECTSLALVEPRRQGSVIAQNWDWIAATKDTVVVLEAECEEGPNFVTVVEAGLLAKTGINSEGLGLVINALASDRTPPEDGIPFHVLLRAILAQPDLETAVALLRSTRRASSGNFLLADASGAAIDLEAEPGGPEQIREISGVGNLIAHTNHFLSPDFDGKDESLEEAPDSLTRLARLREVSQEAGASLGRSSLRRALADHAGYPSSICMHPVAAAPPADRWATIAGIIIDLAQRQMFLAPGNPCETPFEELDFGGLLGRRP